MQPLYALHIRLYRAYEHLDALNRETEAFLRTRPYIFTNEDDPEDGRKIYRMKILHYPPLRLSLIAADTIHNLRSTLDNFWWQIVVRYKPGGPADWEKFPICGSRSDWDRAKGGLGYLPSELLGLIEVLQPYVRDEAGQTPYKLNWLWRLNELSRKDKHRELADLSFRIAKLEPPPGNNEWSFRTFPAIRQDNQIVCEATPLVANADSKFDLGFSICIAFGPRPFDSEVDVREALRSTYEGLQNTVLPILGTFIV